MANNQVKIEIIGDDKFSKNFSKAQRSLKNLAAGARQAATKVAKVGAAMAGVAFAIGAAMVKSSMASIDALAKTADKLGVTTEALSGLRHAAELSGVSASTLDKAILKMGVGISEAAQGTGEAKAALEELGLSAERLNKVPISQQMQIVADALGNVENHTDKVRIAYDLFGAKGVGLLNMMKNGSAGMSEMAEEADKLGIAVSRIDAAQIEGANDAVTRAKGVFTGLGNQLATAFSPIIQGVADAFRQSALDAAGFGNIGQKVATALVKAFGFVADMFNGLRVVLLGIQLVAQSFFGLMLSLQGQLLRSLDPLIEKYNSIAEVFGMATIANKAAEFYENLGGIIVRNAEQTRDKIAEILAAPPPSTGIEAAFDRIQLKSRETAEAVARDAAGKAETGTADRLNSRQKLQADGAQKLAQFEMKTALEKTQFVVSQADSQFSALAANSKKSFAVQKAFQISQALVNTYSGATQALAAYPPPLGPIMAGLTVASGLAQVAQIRAQSFEGGGFTGTGSRSGGEDGKGGFMAMLHPNESVIDHTKGQGLGGVTVINNIEASGGGDIEVRIRAAVEQGSAQTIATIQDLMRRRRFA